MLQDKDIPLPISNVYLSGLFVRRGELLRSLLSIDFKRSLVFLVGMAKVIIFPDQASFENSRKYIDSMGVTALVVQPPRFCLGLVAPTVIDSGGPKSLADELRQADVAVSGVIPYRPAAKEILKASPPNSKWTEALGTLAVSTVRPSLTDPLKLRVEVIPGKSLALLIPLMARLIRGGSYRFDVPVLAFEEEHRLLVISPERFVICRADDLLDAWIMLRSFVDLVISAWDSRSNLGPEKQRRQGIGAIEIFKRLPSTDCKRCGKQNCMEFATGLFTGKFGIEQCAPIIEEEWRPRLESLQWLMQVIGLNGGTGNP
ncbi:MAG: (Fe-S)-binding protein [Desulfomonilaceae bacterium]